MEQRKMERRAVGPVFQDIQADRRRPGQDRRGIYRAPLAPGAIRPAFDANPPQRERRSDRSSGME